MKVASGLLTFLLSALLTAAQIGSARTSTADDLLAHARQTYTQQGPKAALPEFERALATFRTAGDRRREAITLGYLGNCYRRLGDFPRALDFVQRGMDIKRTLGDKLEVGKSHNQFGLIYWEMADYPKAIDHLQQAVAIAHELSSYELEAQARNNLGLVYDEMGDYHRSLQQYQRTLEIDRAAHSDGEADTLANIGGVHLLLGHYREALEDYQRALVIHERLGLKPTASIDVGNMGICYSAIGEGPKALASFDRALNLAREAGLGKEQADWHKAKGTALLRLGKFDPAMREYEQAEKVYEVAGLKRELVEALNETGDLRLMLGDISSAETNYRRALELANAIGNDHGVTANLMSLGELERRRKRYPQAESNYSEALARAHKVDDRASAVSALEQLALVHREQGKLGVAEKEAKEADAGAKAFAAPPAQARALFSLAEVQRSQQHFEQALQQYSAAQQMEKAILDPDLGWRLAYGRGQTLEKLDRNEEAVAAYKEAVGIVEGVRGQLAEERFRAGYIEDKYQVYVALVELLLKLEKPDQAFFYSEKLRARAFLDQLNRGVSAPALTEAQRREEIELRERIRQLRRASQREWERPDNERRNEALEQFSTELASAERAYQNLLDGLRRTAPDYAMTQALAVPSSAEVQQLLPSGTALVEYVIVQDKLAFLVLTSDRVRGTTFPISAEKLQSRVELLRSLIVHTQSDEWRTPAAGLRRILIGSVEDQGWLRGIRRLYLIPNGSLNYVPFAALPRIAGGPPRFLADDYSLAYLPSAAALVYAQSNTNSHPTLLAVVPERAHLRYANQEARDVSRLFQPRSLLLTGKGATKLSFEHVAGNYEFLHLATHGYLNRYTPLLSGLELEPDNDDDGLLEVHDILDLKLHATLVTLSACETALGSGYFSETPAGDEFVGLTRAFISAGSQAVLASLWAVDDRSTSQLMVNFYRSLPKDGKAGALTAAQRAMRLGDARYSHPYYWAPFVLVGKMD